MAQVKGTAVIASLRFTMVLAGARNLKAAHPSCIHRGDAVCRFEGDWDA